MTIRRKRSKRQGKDTAQTTAESQDETGKGFITDLPLLAQVGIMQFLDLGSLLRMSQTCHTFYALVQSSHQIWMPRCRHIASILGIEPYFSQQPTVRQLQEWVCWRTPIASMKKSLQLANASHRKIPLSDRLPEDFRGNILCVNTDRSTDFVEVFSAILQDTVGVFVKAPQTDTGLCRLLFIDLFSMNRCFTRSSFPNSSSWACIPHTNLMVTIHNSIPILYVWDLQARDIVKVQHQPFALVTTAISDISLLRIEVKYRTVICYSLSIGLEAKRIISFRINSTNDNLVLFNNLNIEVESLRPKPQFGWSVAQVSESMIALRADNLFMRDAQKQETVIYRLSDGHLFCQFPPPIHITWQEAILCHMSDSKFWVSWPAPSYDPQTNARSWNLSEQWTSVFSIFKSEKPYTKPPRSRVPQVKYKYEMPPSIIHMQNSPATVDDRYFIHLSLKEVSFVCVDMLKRLTYAFESTNFDSQTSNVVRLSVVSKGKDYKGVDATFLELKLSSDEMLLLRG